METKLFLKIRFWVQFLLRNQISIKTSRLRNNVLTRFAPRTTTSFSLCVLILKAWLCSKFLIENKILKWNFQKKRHQILEQTFSCTMKIWNEKFPKCQVCFELKIFHPGRFRKQNFSKNHILEKKYFPETQFLSSIFIEKSGYDEKFTSKKSRFDSLCSAENNKFSTFRAHFKRHVFDANFFIENQSLKWNFPKKRIRFWSKRFPVQWKFEKKNFQNVRFLIESFSFRQISKTNLFE